MYMLEINEVKFTGNLSQKDLIFISDLLFILWDFVTKEMWKASTLAFYFSPSYCEWNI